MIESAVRYLRDAGIPFRLFSYPSPEELPTVAHPLPRGALLVEAHVLLVDGRASLACVPASDAIEIAGLANTLHASVLDAADELLPGYRAPLPPLGGLFGVPLLVDRTIPSHAVLVFRAFGPHDYIEVAYDDFARLEHPRIELIATRGELTA